MPKREVIADNRPTNGAQLQRLRFIDAILYHYGYLNRAVIMDFFGLSTPQVSLDIAAYIAAAPNNLIYNESARHYECTTEFARVFE